MPTPARPRAVFPLSAMAGEECRLSRLETNQWSWASEPAHGKTHWPSGTPAARAASTEHSNTAAAWSVCMLAFISLGYGKPIMRLSGPGVRISSGVRKCGDHAYGFDSATRENRDHSWLIFT